MTEKEAIKILDNIANDIKESTELGQALEIALVSLEKQIPKEPYYYGDGYWNGELVYDTWTCPNCSKSYEVDFDDYDFCPNCGQAICWSEEEE